MASWNIAIVGATSLVGSALLELLPAQQTLPLNQLTLLDEITDIAESETIRFEGKQLNVQSYVDFDWSSVDLAIFALPLEQTAQYAELAADAGCIVLDLSGYYRDQPAVPLVVPTVNDYVLADYRASNIVALAHPAVSQLLLSLAALGEDAQLSQLHCSTYLPASLYGKAGIEELAGQSARLLNGMAIESNIFAKQLAFNLLPLQHQAQQALEQQLLAECRRILANPQLAISFDLVQVPVFYGLGQHISVVNAYPLPLTQLEQQIADANYLQAADESDLATPVTEAESELTIKLSHLRYSPGFDEQLQWWAVSDNIRLLSAKLALDVAGTLLNEYR